MPELIYPRPNAVPVTKWLSLEPVPLARGTCYRIVCRTCPGSEDYFDWDGNLYGSYEQALRNAKNNEENQ